MRVLAVLLIVLVACVAPEARSQPIDVRDAILHFRDRLQARDFQAIETRHRDLQQGPAKSAIGVVLADVYVNWGSIDHCYTIARNPQSQRAAGWTPSRCDAYYVGLFDAWEKSTPLSILPRLGRAWTRLATARYSDVDLATRRDHLAAALRLLDEVPPPRRSVDWYLTAIAVATSAGMEPDRFETLVKESLQRHPGRPQLARAAIQYQLPIHGGTRDDALALADRMARWVPVADSGRIYAEAVSAYFEEADERPPSILGLSRFDWPRMRDGLLARFSEHPNAWLRNRVAMYACMAGDRETLRLLLSDGGGEEPSAWYPVSEQACRRLAGSPFSTPQPAIGRS